MISEIDIPRYEDIKVIVYGDLILDRYWYGQALRISPEAPIPVVNVDQIETRPGGAANVAINIASLGASVELLGVVGNDKESKELELLLDSKSINCQFYHLTNYSTVTKLRILGKNQQLLRLDFEKSLESYEDRNLLQCYRHALSHDAKVVVLSDYAKGALFNVTTLIQYAKEKAFLY